MADGMMRRASSAHSAGGKYATSPRAGSFHFGSAGSEPTIPPMSPSEQSPGTAGPPNSPKPLCGSQGRRDSFSRAPFGSSCRAPSGPLDQSYRASSLLERSRKTEVTSSSVRVEPTGRYCKASDLVFALESEARKIANYSAAPVFFLFLLLYTLSCSLSYGVDSNGAVRRMQSSLRLDVFRQVQFMKIQEGDAFYDWLRDVSAQNLFCQSEPCDKEGLALGASPGISTSDNMALNFLLLRQHRQNRSTDYCRNTQSFPLSEMLRTRIEEAGCPTGYLDVGLNGMGYGGGMPQLGAVLRGRITDPFVPDSAKQDMPRMHWVEGDDTFYGDREQQFSLMLPFDLLVQNVTDVINGLQAGNWIDDETKVVFVVGQFYNPAKGEYLVLQFVVEFSVTGDTNTKINSIPFWFFIKGEDWLRGFLFGLDLLFAINLLFIFRDLVRGCIINTRLERCPFGMSECLYLFQFLLFTGTIAMRFQHWRYGDTFRRNMGGVQMFTELNEFAFFFQLEHTFATVSLAVVWLRVLEQLKFTKQLNAVTETLRLGASDLFSLTVIFGIIVTGFAALGQQLYAYHVGVFESMGQAVRFLSVTVFSADLYAGGVLNEMASVQPVLTVLYMGSFVLLSWLLLLNIVLGILAASFAAASATTEDRRWSFKAISKEMYAPFCVNENEEEEEDFEGGPSLARRRSSRQDVELSCSEKFSRCIWPWLFLTDVGQKKAYNRVKCIKVLKALALEQGLPLRQLEVQEDYLLSQDLRDRGWMLNTVATAEAMRGALARVPEDFAQAEADRQEKHTRVIRDLIVTREDVLGNRQATIDRTQEIEELVREVLSKLGVYHNELGDKMTEQVSQTKDLETNLRREMTDSKDEMAERLTHMRKEVDDARRELLQELTNEGERLLETVLETTGELRTRQDVLMQEVGNSSPRDSPRPALPGVRQEVESESMGSPLGPSSPSGPQNLAAMLLERADGPDVSEARASAMRRVAGALNRTAQPFGGMRRRESSQFRQRRMSLSRPGTPPLIIRTLSDRPQWR
eukprot:Hpha_TRINITY_DN29652_c0_g1::TRINITY_DN29652_c0_g1_i1::g.165075::m.165075